MSGLIVCLLLAGRAWSRFALCCRHQFRWRIWPGLSSCPPSRTRSRFWSTLRG